MTPAVLGPNRGFSLVELMIVVAIVAILAGIAYPSYTSHVKKGKRAEGKARVLTAAQRLERYYTDNSTYTTDLGPLFGFPANTAIYSGDQNQSDSPYKLVVTAAAGGISKGYTITAQINAPSNFTDADCGNLALTSTGVKSVSGTLSSQPSVALRTCW